MITRKHVLALFVAAGLMTAVQAEPPKTAPPAAPADVLSGPKVTDNSPPGAPTTFDGRPIKDRKTMTVAIPREVFKREVWSVVGPDGPAELRADPAQATKIRAADEEFQKAEQKFRKDHAADIAKVQAELGRAAVPTDEGAGGRGLVRGQPEKKAAPKRSGGGKPTDSGGASDGGNMQGDQGGGAASETDQARVALMELAQKLKNEAPKSADANDKVWNLLTLAQQSAIRPKLEAYIKAVESKVSQRKADAKAKKQIKKQQGGSDPAAPGQPSKKQGKKKTPTGTEDGSK